MFTCPNCRSRLLRTQNVTGIYWVCKGCGGRAVSIAVLRKALREESIQQAWAKSREATAGKKPCPTCIRRMVEVDAEGLKVDVCKTCQFIWFDAQEYEQMPAAATRVSTERELPQQAKEALAIYEVQKLAEQTASNEPMETWQYVPAIFGLPIETDAPTVSRYPLATWTVAAIVVVVSIAVFFSGSEAVQSFGLIPAETFRYGGLTLLTSFFLHGGIMHLIGNMYFLLIFGDNVEDYLGRAKFLVLLLVATLGGDIAHVIGDPRSTMPCIGASGGISGIITFYALEFPKSKLGFMFRAYYAFRWVQIPAWGGFALWIVLQLSGAVWQMAGFSNVSSLAHLGGVAAGFIVWFVWRNRDKRARTKRVP